jgi:hypothetical protein
MNFAWYIYIFVQYSNTIAKSSLFPMAKSVELQQICFKTATFSLMPMEKCRITGN